jgi:two-component system sensor histidine kinase HydH
MAHYLLESRNMIAKFQNKRFWFGVSPWALIGAGVVLLPLFAFMTLTTIDRQQEKSIQLLLEKGAALIRSFEAGTRSGMMGMRRGGGFRLQQLLTETAQQPDIVHLLVTEVTGEVIAHNDLERIGVPYGINLDLKTISEAKNLKWRILDYPDGNRVFEVYRRFSPAERPTVGKPVRGRMHGRMRRFHAEDQNTRRSLGDTPKIIFVGLDMTAIQDAQRADIRHAVIMGMILLMIGIAGITLLFLLQGYRAAQTTLSRVKAFSDNVVDNMPIGLIALDEQRRIAAFNHTAEALLQLPFDEVYGRSAAKVLPPELGEQIERLDNDRQIIEKEIGCTIGGGRVVPLEIGASRLADEHGTRLGYIFLLKDLTEVRSLRHEVERSRRLASVGQLAAGIAHEIRNPLSSIKGFATYFKQRYQAVPEDQQTADIMIQEVDRLNRVVSQLLEFARPVSISPKSIPIPDLVADSVKLIEQQARDKQISIDTRIAAEIDRIDIDADRLSQVLLNFCLNAIEAMEPGGKLRIEAVNSAGGDTGSLEIRIADTGSGIAKENLPKIFDPYFTTKTSGTGLGLAIAHNIVEAMGGTIEVESKVDEGTTVKIIIPVKRRQKISDKFDRKFSDFEKHEGHTQKKR